MSAASRKDTSTGHVVNMFSNDTMQVMRIFSYFDYVTVSRLLIITALYLIYLQVGIAVFVGIGLVVLMIPITIFYFLNLFRAAKIGATDHRGAKSPGHGHPNQGDAVHPRGADAPGPGGHWAARTATRAGGPTANVNETFQSGATGLRHGPQDDPDAVGSARPYQAPVTP
eukprot:gene38207-47171_t